MTKKVIFDSIDFELDVKSSNLDMVQREIYLDLLRQYWLCHFLPCESAELFQLILENPRLEELILESTGQELLAFYLAASWRKMKHLFRWNSLGVLVPVHAHELDGQDYYCHKLTPKIAKRWQTAKKKDAKVSEYLDGSGIARGAGGH